MNNEDLKKANKIQDEINRLEFKLKLLSDPQKLIISISLGENSEHQRERIYLQGNEIGTVLVANKLKRVYAEQLNILRLELALI